MERNKPIDWDETTLSENCDLFKIVNVHIKENIYNDPTYMCECGRLFNEETEQDLQGTLCPKCPGKENMPQKINTFTTIVKKFQSKFYSEHQDNEDQENQYGDYDHDEGNFRKPNQPISRFKIKRNNILSNVNFQKDKNLEYSKDNIVENNLNNKNGNDVSVQTDLSINANDDVVIIVKKSSVNDNEDKHLFKGSSHVSQKQITSSSNQILNNDCDHLLTRSQQNFIETEIIGDSVEDHCVILKYNRDCVSPLLFSQDNKTEDELSQSKDSNVGNDTDMTNIENVVEKTSYNSQSNTNMKQVSQKTIDVRNTNKNTSENIVNKELQDNMEIDSEAIIENSEFVDDEYKDIPKRKEIKKINLDEDTQSKMKNMIINDSEGEEDDEQEYISGTPDKNNVTINATQKPNNNFNKDFINYLEHNSMKNNEQNTIEQDTVQDENIYDESKHDHEHLEENTVENEIVNESKHDQKTTDKEIVNERVQFTNEQKSSVKNNNLNVVSETSFNYESQLIRNSDNKNSSIDIHKIFDTFLQKVNVPLRVVTSNIESNEDKHELSLFLKIFDTKFEQDITDETNFLIIGVNEHNKVIKRTPKFTKAIAAHICIVNMEYIKLCNKNKKIVCIEEKLIPLDSLGHNGPWKSFINPQENLYSNYIFYISNQHPAMKYTIAFILEKAGGTIINNIKELNSLNTTKIKVILYDDMNEGAFDQFKHMFNNISLAHSKSLFDSIAAFDTKELILEN